MTREQALSQVAPMSIEIGSKWVKDGEVVEVFKITTVSTHDEVIFFTCKKGINHVLFDYDFLEQYKPYEPDPVFEWQWAYITNSLLRWHITNYMTEEEFKTWKCGANSSLEYKRLDFTKR